MGLSSSQVRNVQVGGHLDPFRDELQRFIRSFGLLSTDHTPCGQPLPPSHAHALMVLWRGGARARPTQQQLGRVLGIDKSNVARLCARMERAGHVRQERSRTDGRSRLLVLTPHGRRLAAKVETASRRRFEALLEAIPAPTRRDLVDSLGALNRAIASLLRLSEVHS